MTSRGSKRAQSKIIVAPSFIKRFRRREMAVKSLSMQVDVDARRIHLRHGVNCERLPSGSSFDQLLTPNAETTSPFRAFGDPFRGSLKRHSVVLVTGNDPAIVRGVVNPVLGGAGMSVGSRLGRAPVAVNCPWVVRRLPDLGQEVAVGEAKLLIL